MTNQLPSDIRLPTGTEMDRHIARGRRLRAEAMATAASIVRAWVRDRAGTIALPGLRRRRAARLDGETATSLRTPLTAIRSAAEILHEHPEMAPHERARFVRILLKEEQRLERLLAALTRAERGHLAR